MGHVFCILRNMKTIEEVSRFHGHICPGLALGYRVSQYALAQFGQSAVDEELVAIVENDSCAVDAVQFMTACTFGKGNLIFHDYGKQVYTFLSRTSGRALRIAIKWDGPVESDLERYAWKRYASGDRSQEVLTMVHERKSRKIQSIMEAADEALFSVTEAVDAMPPTARIHASVKCEACGEKVMEPRARLLKGKVVCLPCFEREK